MRTRHVITMVILWISASYAQQVALSGTVTKSDGSAAVGLTVVLENGGTVEGESVTDGAGNYAMSVNTGTYDQLRVRNMGSEIAGLPSNIEHTANTSLSITTNTTINITMPAYIHLSGKVLYTTGDLVAGASLMAKKWINNSESPPWDTETSGSDGAYSLYQEPGGIKIWITPSGGEQVALVYTINSDTTMDIVIPKTLTVSGSVTNYSGSPIRDITIAFEKGTEQFQTTTDPSGSYTKSLNPGTYKIRLRNGVGATIADGVPASLEETIIESVVLSTDTSIVLAAPFYPALRCSVVNSAGNPVADIPLMSKKWDGGSEAPPWDYDTTGTNGVGTLRVGSGSNKVWVTPPAVSNYVEMDFEVTATADSTIVITLTRGATLSGTVYRADNTPVSGINIALEKDADQWMKATDASGAYSIPMQPGVYRLRVRNLGTSIPGIPATLEHTVTETLDLTQSVNLDIYLPLFPTITGVVRNALGSPVSNVSIQAKRWENGSESPPWAEYTTGSDGAYTLTVGKGPNKVWITPQPGTSLGAFSFIENFEKNTTKDIFIPDQAKGITRIQPSVITRGESGTVMIAGIGSQFTNGTVTINLGSHITVSNVKVISNITLTADITIDGAAATGNHDVLVSNGSISLVGPSLLTITAPASAPVTLDAQGNTTEEILIGDGTGTELRIPVGTGVVFPTGAKRFISFNAPILDGADPDLVTGELTDIQRILSPSGLSFKDTVYLTCQYSDQDVEGMDENTLNPYFYEDDSTGTGTVGDAMIIIARDTAANTITFAIPHFSMFRVAAGTILVPISQMQNAISLQTTQFVSVTSSQAHTTKITFFIAPVHERKQVSLEVFDCKGRMVRSLVKGRLGIGMHKIFWNHTNSYGADLGSSVLILYLQVGNEFAQSKEMIFLK